MAIYSSDPSQDAVEKAEPSVGGRMSPEKQTQMLDSDDGEVFQNIPGQTDFRALGW